MARALDLAREADQRGEVPVGALVVRDGCVLGQGRNRSISDHDPCGHAEIVALRAAGRAADNYRLPGADVYVTLEPCLMCAGAMIHARIRRLVFAAADPRTGAAGSVYSLLDDPRHNHRVEVVAGVMRDEAARLMREFFRARR